MKKQGNMMPPKKCNISLATDASKKCIFEMLGKTEQNYVKKAQ